MSPIHFGLVVSQDVFQKQLETAFEGRNGVTGITDDTFVYGSSDVEHDRNLTKLMETAKTRARYSTKTKCDSRLRKSSFFCHTRTPQGIKPDNKKVSAIIDMKPPKDVKSLQTFLSLVLTLNVRYLASSGDLKGSITSSTANPALCTQITSHWRRSSRRN